MSTFLYLFRRDESQIPQQSVEEMQAITERWMDWVKELQAEGHLADKGNRLKKTGKIIQADGTITDGPFVELKEAIGGYIAVQANDLDEAAKLAKGCPIFMLGGRVEVREIDQL